MVLQPPLREVASSLSTHELMTTRDAATTTNAASLMTGVGDAGARGLPAHRAAPACYWKVMCECPGPNPSSRPSDMPADMPSDMSSEGHCILMAVWGEDDARVPALVLYA